MNWLLLLKNLSGIFSKVSEWLANRQLIKAGETRQQAKSLKKERKSVKKARIARNNTVTNADRVRHDKHNRSRD